MSAPAGQLQAAAAGEAYHIPSFHQPSPLGQQQRKQPAPHAATGSLPAAGVAAAAYGSQQLLQAGFVMVQTQPMEVEMDDA